MKKIKIIVFLILSSFLLAAEAKPEGLCQRFAKNPQSLPSLKFTEETNSEGDATGKIFAVGEGANATKYRVYNMEGTAHGEALCRLKGKTCRDLDYLVDTNGYGMGTNIFLIQDEAKVFVVGYRGDSENKNYVFLGEVQKNGIKILCEFQKKVLGYKKLKYDAAPQVCRDFVEQKYHSIKETKIKSLLLKAPHDVIPRDFVIEGDLLQSGKNLNFLVLDLMSGAGAGCDRSYLGVLSSDRKNLLSERESKDLSKEVVFARALDQLTNDNEYCGEQYQWSIVKIQGKSYLQGALAGPWPLSVPGRASVLSRTLWAYQNEEMKKLCEQEPQVEAEVLPGR